jgi:hypothetical protein
MLQLPFPHNISFKKRKEKSQRQCEAVLDAFHKRRKYSELMLEDENFFTPTLFTADVWVQYQSSSYRICGGTSGTEARFSHEKCFILSVTTTTNSPHPFVYSTIFTDEVHVQYHSSPYRICGGHTVTLGQVFSPSNYLLPCHNYHQFSTPIRLFPGDLHSIYKVFYLFSIEIQSQAINNKNVNFLFSKMSRPALGPTTPPIQPLPGFIPRDKVGVNLTTHHHLLSMLRMGGIMPLLPPCMTLCRGWGQLFKRFVGDPTANFPINFV